MTPKSLLILATTGFLLSACGEKETTNTSETTNSSLDTFIVEKAHPDVKQISTVFADPEPGREVVIGGEVMGRMQPFVEGRAMVVLGDPTKVTPCNRRPGDTCETPWDLCCDSPEAIRSAIATVQFVDGEGKIIKSGLKGFNGIEELTYLTVAGTIADGSNAENLLINAREMFVASESPYKDSPPVSGHGHDHGEHAPEE